MGNNDAYTIFENTVIALYDGGKLDPQLLDALAEPHRGTDIDHGGSRELKTFDGLDLCEVILAIKDPEKFWELRQGYQRLQREHPDVQEPQYDDFFNEQYYEPRFDAVYAIMAGEWGWL